MASNSLKPGSVLWHLTVTTVDVVSVLLHVGLLSAALSTTGCILTSVRRYAIVTVLLLTDDCCDRQVRTYETGRWFGWDLVEYTSHCWWFYDVRDRLDRLAAPRDTRQWRCSAAILPQCSVNDASCETTWEKNIYCHYCTAVDDASVMAYWACQGFPSDHIKFHVRCYPYVSKSICILFTVHAWLKHLLSSS